MTGKRILITALSAALIFILMSVVEERDTFFGAGRLFGFLSASPATTAGNKGLRYDEEYDIRTMLAAYNDFYSSAGKNGVLSVLDGLPATEELRNRTKLEMRMALERDLPRPIGEHTFRMSTVKFTGPDSARVNTIEDWQYGDAVHAATFFRIEMVYDVKKIGGKWIVDEYFIDKPFEDGPQ